MRKLVTALTVVTVALGVGLAAQGKGKGNDKQDQRVAAPLAATVQFGTPQPETPDPAPVGASVTHFLTPNDVTIRKGGRVTFVVNGGGHGIAIHEVNKKTTREDIAEDLCDGATPENPDPVVDRRTRAAVCNGTVVTPVVINGVHVNITGTNNLEYTITDAKGNVVIDSGFNVNIPATPTTPAIVFNNPRLDDTAHSNRLVATSGNSDGDHLNPPAIAGNRAGAFLTGTANPATVGQRIEVQFTRTGRFLVICMNRAHALNDHMFGFVSVTDDDNDDK